MFGKFYTQDGAVFCATCPKVNVTRYAMCPERGGRSTPQCAHCGAWLCPKPRQRNTIKHKPLHNGYNEIRQLSQANLDHSNCTVVTATVCTGKPYAEVNAAFIKAGRLPRRGFNLYKTMDIIKSFGFEMVPVSRDTFISRYPGGHKTLRHVTTHHMDRFNKVWRDGKTYFLNCSQHVAAVKNGELVDWSRNKALRVYSIYEVRPVTHTGGES